MPKRTIFYIDGLNFQHGLEQLKLRKYYWLNYLELANKLLKHDEILVKIKYFTTIVKKFYDPSKHDRQINCISALRTLDKNKFQTIFGKHQENYRICKNYNYQMPDFKEKRTGVSIASEIFRDSCNKKCDVIKLISADSDYIPICKTVLDLFPNTEIEILFSPGRKSGELKKLCHWSVDIFVSTIAQSQFPDPVVNSILNLSYSKPPHWN